MQQLEEQLWQKQQQPQKQHHVEEEFLPWYHRVSMQMTGRSMARRTSYHYHPVVLVELILPLDVVFQVLVMQVVFYRRVHHNKISSC